MGRILKNIPPTNLAMLGRVALVRLGGTLRQQLGVDHLVEPSNASFDTQVKVTTYVILP